MPLDPEIGLVGRDEIVALIDELVERRPRQEIPIVVAYGPGGSGKTTLLDHIQRRFKDYPVARVNLDDVGSRSVIDVLDVIASQLTAYGHPQFGRLRLPRYALARTAIHVVRGNGEPHEPTDDIHARARDFLVSQLTNLRALAQVVVSAVEVAAPTRGLSRLLRPIVHWIVMLAVVAPAWVRWLLGPTFGATTRWYERHGAALFRHSARTRRIDAVILDVWRAARSDDRHELRTLDRLLVQAFLADLRSAYRRRRYRKVNCVVLLDGADLLSPTAHTLFPPEVDEPIPPANDLLELLAEAKVAGNDAPLLVVATKQQAYPDDHETEALRTGGPARVILPVRLAAFTYDQTRQFLAEWNRQKSSTVESQVLVEEIHQVSRGHPLAVRLLTQLVDLRYRRTRVVPSVRALLSAHVPPGEPTADPGETVADYLLLRFLQRFRSVRGGGGESDRMRAQELLARLAAPRRLDIPTVAQILAGHESALSRVGDRGGPRDPAEVWERLAGLSFTERVGDGTTLELHPLLRDLLVRQLLEQSERADSRATAATDPPTYTVVHERLRDYFDQLVERERSPGALVDYLYHNLALGDFQLVAARLQQRIRHGDPSWVNDLMKIVEAPMPVTTRVGLTQKLRARLQTIRTHALRASAGSRPVNRLLRSDVRLRIEAVVMALWDLNSCTSTARRTPELFERIVDAYTSLNPIMAVAPSRQPESEDTSTAAPSVGTLHPPVRREVVRFRRLQRAAEAGAAAPPAAPLPAAARAGEVRPYPPVFPPRQTTRRVVLGLAVLALLAYGVVYARHVMLRCEPAAWYDVATVLKDLRDDSTSLSRKPDDQCIGIAERASRFVGSDEAMGDDDQEIAELSRLIAAENDRVLEEHRANGRAYITVVVATMLSSAEEGPQRDLSAGVNELRGAYLAQREWNRFGTSLLKPEVQVRLVLANVGGNSEYAVEVARQIRRYAAADPTVVAVSGMGQTRSSTIKAIEDLGGVSLPGVAVPMVGSAISGNDLAGKPYFLRVAPSNARQAMVGVEFARTSSLLRGRRMFLLYDTSDLYSSDLAASYQAALQGDDRDVVEMTYEAGSAGAARTLQQRVDEICRRSRRPLVLYAGRSNEMPTLLDLLDRSPCGRDAYVLGGDDLSQLETADFAERATQPGWKDYVNGRLYFTTFAPTRQGWAARSGGAERVPAVVRRFFDYYASQRKAADGSFAFRSGPNGHIVLAYDAIKLIMDSVDRVSRSGADLTRSNVFRALRATGGGDAFEGAGGVVDFGAPDRTVPRAGAEPRCKLVIVQRVVLRSDRLVPEYQPQSEVPCRP